MPAKPAKPTEYATENATRRAPHSAAKSAENQALQHPRPRQQRLFYNEVDCREEYQLTRTLTDNYIAAIVHIRNHPGKGFQDFVDTGLSEYAFSTEAGKRVVLSIDMNYLQHRYREGVASGDFEPGRLSEREAKAQLFQEALERHASGEVLALNEILWAYASLKGSFYFNGDKLTDIMTLKPHPDVQPYKADTRTKESLTDRLRLLSHSQISLEESRKKDTKATVDSYRFIGVSRTEYAKKRGTTEYNKKIITRLWGELLPDYPKRDMIRGRNRNLRVLDLTHRSQLDQMVLNVYLANAFDQIRMGNVEALARKSEDQLRELLVTKSRDFLRELLGIDSTRNRPAHVNRYVQKALENCIGRSIERFAPEQITDEVEHVSLYGYPSSEQLALSAGQKPRR